MWLGTASLGRVDASCSGRVIAGMGVALPCGVYILSQDCRSKWDNRFYNPNTFLLKQEGLLNM
jgi:hypothetical protein